MQKTQISADGTEITDPRSDLPQPALEARLVALAAAIPALDEAAMEQARARQAQLTKPAHALGRLEELSMHLAGITAQGMPRLARKAIVVAAADHGVCAEGVSPYPQTVTAQMVTNFLTGGAAINVLARQAGARVTVVDCGVAHPILHREGEQVESRTAATATWGAARLVRRPLAAGTANLAQGAAMSYNHALEAVLLGAEVVEAEAETGLDLLGLGEMGIGNTTAAAAMACALGGWLPSQVVGRGAGLDDAGLAHKIEVVARALAVNGLAGGDADVLGAAAQGAHPGGMAYGLEVLSRVGGFELGVLAGAMLAAAARRIPVVIDGFIVGAAAMLAVQLAPRVQAFLIPAHQSAEGGHASMLAWLNLKPYLSLEMRLGEGSGAALGMWLADAAWQTLGGMATFAEAQVAQKAASQPDDRPDTHPAI